MYHEDLKLNSPWPSTIKRQQHPEESTTINLTSLFQLKLLLISVLSGMTIERGKNVNWISAVEVSMKLLQNPATYLTGSNCFLLSQSKFPAEESEIGIDWFIATY